ncbi:dihydrolipoyl dehydrogenase [Clostridium sp. CAG:967]|nr:dihydrolipoyl dehydrogenase [Clostridium sp. CAG:967]
MTNFDLGIIGGGPAGYTAALHARANGLSVVMFEKDKIGGVCLNRGCIPTKTILHSAEVYEDLKCSDDLGIKCDGLSFDFARVVERKEKTVEKLRKNLELTLKNSGVVTVNSEAKIITKNKIEADGEVFECKKIIAATGSSPRALKGIGFDHEFVLNSDDILNLTVLPESIAIVGSGAIGIEWARILSAFDVEVSVIEAAEHLLPLADVEVSKRIERIFKSKKIKMYLSNGVEKIDGRKVYLSSGEVLEPELALLAVGRKPDIDEKIEGITYLGDAYGSIQLAHFAIKQAIAEVTGVEFDENLVPSVVYGCPEIAWIGLREQDLEEGTYKKANLLISALGKSHCDNCSDGFIKILSRDGKIIGAHIVSKEASSLIQEITIAMQNNIAIEDLKKVCFAHPTYSEGIFECLFKL